MTHESESTANSQDMDDVDENPQPANLKPTDQPE